MPKTFIGGTQLLDPEDVLRKLQLKEGTRFADLGCGGKGHFVFPASNMVGKTGVVYAVDILKSVLEGIDKRALTEDRYNIKTVWSDLEQYGATRIDPESLDAALLANILYITTQDENVMNEAVRLLKSGGHLLVVDWKPTGAPFGPPVESRTSVATIRELAAPLQLKEIDAFDAGKYHFGVLFQKP